MKIVNLNEYNENDNLKNKLRQRMDNHQPELSDSVWDRIHHQMDVRDANRKKRFLWWFSSVAVVVLTSGVLAFLMLNSNTPQQVAVQNNVVTVPQNTAPKTETQTAPTTNTTPATPLPNTTSNTGSAVTPNNTSTTTNGGGTTTNITDKNTTQANGGLPTKEQTTTTTTDNDVPTSTTDKEDKKVVTEENLPKAQQGEELPTQAVEEVITTPKVDETLPKQPKTDKKPTTTNSIKNSRWFIGASFSYNQTYRTVSDISKAVAYPDANDRNTFEKKSYSPSYGIDVGFYPAKNFFIKTGVNIFNVSENVQYNVNKRNSTLISVIYGNEQDSIAAGNKVKKQNTYNYIQIPLEIGYSKNIGTHWGVFASGGVAFNILQNYNYYFYETFYGNAIIPPDAAENYKDMYKNYTMLSGTVGAQYNITNKWAATIGFSYRRAINSAANKKYAVDVRPYTIGATTGIAYRF